MDQVLETLRMWLDNHIVQALLLTFAGVVIGWILAWLRRYRLQRQVRGGDAREVLAIEQIIVHDRPDGTVTMRVRSFGSAPLQTVLPNPVAYDAFLDRARATRSTAPLVSMKDQMGSYLLYLLTPWVCGMVRHGNYPHDIWVMAPVSEPGVLSSHQSSVIILIRRADLDRFKEWDICKTMQVEHGSDGGRILTLWHMAQEFVRQLAEVKRCQAQGKPSTFVETMYVLDLGLDTDEVELPTKNVPWNRFGKVLKALGLSGS
jgi:hypothetical protein